MTTSILGTRVRRREDPALLRGASCYVDDVDLPDAAHVTYVTSTIAHARITGIDLDEALAAPGVLAVVTAADVDLADRKPPVPMLNQAMTRPLLARDVVRFVGEPVAAVISETRAQGVDAAELVWVDYDPLEPVVDPAAALDGAPVVHESAGTNLVFELGGDEQPDFDGCEVVVRHRILNQRLAPASIEPRAGAAAWRDGRLVQWSSTQGPHPTRDGLAEAYGLEPDQVRVVTRDVGGGFGAKSGLYPEEILLGELSRRVDRPVKWVPTRSDDMVGMGHGRAQVQDVEIGGRRDGTITAYRLTVLQDGGAYPAFGSVLPFMTRTMLTGTYAVTDVAFSSRSAITTTTPVGAYRGAGRPEAAAAIERAVDLFAAEIGMDPAEVRRKNLVADDAFPYTTPVGTTYDVGGYGGALDKALQAAGYDALREEQAARRSEGGDTAVGIGVACYVEITASQGGGEFAALELRGDGSVAARVGASPQGQGHETSWAMIVAERLGIDIDRVVVIHGDTDLTPSGGFTGGSRSVQVVGASMSDAAVKLVEAARQRAADQLEAAVEDIVFDDDRGAFHVAGTPTRAATWDHLAGGVGEAPLEATSDFAADGPTFPFGAHVAVVEVDLATGGVRLLRHVACDDAGTILNPTLFDGQVHGGIAQGVAQALLEEVRYDDDGNPLTANLADYAAISAAELPLFERVPQESPTFRNPLGAKGVGEAGTIGATPAVQNAVVDALAHLGVRHIDLPCTPERVWRALQEARTLQGARP